MVEYAACLNANSRVRERFAFYEHFGGTPNSLVTSAYEHGFAPGHFPTRRLPPLPIPLNRCRGGGLQERTRRKASPWRLLSNCLVEPTHQYLVSRRARPGASSQGCRLAPQPQRQLTRTPRRLLSAPTPRRFFLFMPTPLRLVLRCFFASTPCLFVLSWRPRIGASESPVVLSRSCADASFFMSLGSHDGPLRTKARLCLSTHRGMSCCIFHNVPFRASSISFLGAQATAPSVFGMAFTRRRRLLSDCVVALTQLGLFPRCSLALFPRFGRVCPRKSPNAAAPLPQCFWRPRAGAFPSSDGDHFAARPASLPRFPMEKSLTSGPPQLVS
jgi:hypothetical protein